MPLSIGTIERSAGDDWPASVDLSAIDVFEANAVTAATLSTSAAAGVTVPTFGTVVVADSVATFRVSGGTAGDSTVTITATNAATPPNVIVRTFTVRTK